MGHRESISCGCRELAAAPLLLSMTNVHRERPHFSKTTRSGAPMCLLGRRDTLVQGEVGHPPASLRNYYGISIGWVFDLSTPNPTGVGAQGNAGFGTYLTFTNASTCVQK